MPALSIIVPIYNTGNYLEECIYSILCQTFFDFELILVDDGSTDDSSEICKSFLEKDNRVRYIYQDNAGALNARYTGIKLSESEYIGFVDSDDYIDSTFFEKMMSLAKEYSPDLIESGFYVNSQIRLSKIEMGFYNGDDITHFFKNMICYNDTYDEGLIVSNCTKLFKKDQLVKAFESVLSNNKKICYGEDALITYIYSINCSSIYISNICEYHYISRSGSAVHSIHEDFLENISDYYRILKHAFDTSSYKNTLIDQLEKRIKYLILEAPRFIGFSLRNQFYKYAFPFVDKLDSKIALYGAGDIGKKYYHRMIAENKPPVIWVDENYMRYKDEYNVLPVANLNNTYFDYLIIAVKHANVASEITLKLNNMGINSKRILWKELQIIDY